MRRVVVLVAFFASAAVLVGACDLGHHNDLAATVFSTLLPDWSHDTRDMVRLGSFWIDYFSFFCTLGTGEAKKIHRYELLHADNLRNTSDFGSYAAQLILNVRQLLATHVKTPAQYAVLLGLTLHINHDMHAHSNFGQGTGLYRASCNCFRGDSYYTQPNVPGLWTGGCGTCTLPEYKDRKDIPDHGNNCKGPNRDNYVRPDFEEAYVAAFLNELQWVKAFEKWANEVGAPGIVEQARTWKMTPAERAELNKELYYQFNLPAFVHLFNIMNGNWKGPYSGCDEKFLVDIVTSRSMKNVWREFVYNTSDTLTAGLLSKYPTPDPKTWPDDADVRAMKWNGVFVRIPEYKVLKEQTFGYDSPFAYVTINGQTFHEPPMHKRPDFKPYWKAMAFVPASQRKVNIKIEFWDLHITADPTIYDINPGVDADDLELVFDTVTQELSGDVNGTYIDENHPAVIEGTGETAHGIERPARLKLAVFTRPIGNCDGETAITCPNPPLPDYC